MTHKMSWQMQMYDPKMTFNIKRSKVLYICYNIAQRRNRQPFLSYRSFSDKGTGAWQECNLLYHESGHRYPMYVLLKPVSLKFQSILLVVSLVSDGCPELRLIGQDQLLKTRQNYIRRYCASTATSNTSSSCAYGGQWINPNNGILPHAELAGKIGDKIVYIIAVCWVAFQRKRTEKNNRSIWSRRYGRN